MDEEPAESLRVRVSKQANMGDIVGVCYRLPDQEEVVAEAFFRQQEEASCLQALVLVGTLATRGSFQPQVFCDAVLHSVF